MGVFDGIKKVSGAVGSATDSVSKVANAFSSKGTEMNNDDAERQVSKILLDEESIEYSYKLIRDMIIFTNKRLILVNKQGLTGNKTEYLSIPYKSIQRFSIENAGTFDLDSELKLYSSSGLIMQLQFGRGETIYNVQKKLCDKIL